jgi:hypothetical protein
MKYNYHDTVTKPRVFLAICDVVVFRCEKVDPVPGPETVLNVVAVEWKEPKSINGW